MVHAMTSEDTLRLARQLADQSNQEKTMAHQTTNSENAVLPLNDELLSHLRLEAPDFLHEKEIENAIRVVNLVAAGRNPFAKEPFDKLLPEHSNAALQAVCVLVSIFAQAKKIPAPKHR